MLTINDLFNPLMTFGDFKSQIHIVYFGVQVQLNIHKKSNTWNFPFVHDPQTDKHTNFSIVVQIKKPKVFLTYDDDDDNNKTSCFLFCSFFFFTFSI